MNYTILLLKFAFIFVTCSLAGWVLEFFWRRFLGKARRWGNPGFLNGPWLPIYGTGALLLYLMSEMNIYFYYRPLLYIIVLTVWEYIAGVIFLKFFNLRLWDYRDRRFNIQGVVCFSYSLIWGALGMIFHLFIYPLLLDDVNFLLTRLELSFFVGVICGVYALDIVQSFNLAGRLKTIIQESEVVFKLDFEQFKLELSDRIESGVKNRTKFLLPFHGELGSSLKNRVQEHFSRFSKRG